MARLYVSERTAHKISRSHQIAEREVRDAVVCVEGLRYVWEERPEKGLRVIVETRIRTRRALIVLYPASDPLGDAFNLGSAYFVDG